MVKTETHYIALYSQTFRENNKYMLFAGWEVRMVKNCDLGLENTARGRRLDLPAGK